MTNQKTVGTAFNLSRPRGVSHPTFEHLKAGESRLVVVPVDDWMHAEGDLIGIRSRATGEVITCVCEYAEVKKGNQCLVVGSGQRNLFAEV